MLKINEGTELFGGFVKHNQAVWAAIKPSSGKSVLIEVNRSEAHHVVFSYLGQALAQHYSSEIVGFSPSPRRLMALPLSVQRFLIRRFVNSSRHKLGRVYRSIGASGALAPRWTKGQIREANELTGNFFSSSPSKREFETLSVRGIVIGDLIYDTYLRQRSLPTVDLNDRTLQTFTNISVRDFLFWCDKIKPDVVSAVVSSHNVYNLAFPLRLAVNRGIPAFEVIGHAIHRLSTGRPNASSQVEDYPQIFAELSPTDRKDLLLKAKSLLERRFSGDVASKADITRESARGFGASNGPRALSSSEALKVMIATHLFTDAPHVAGRALFPDFFEWLEFLCKLSLDTPYEWYVKVHPDAEALKETGVISGFLSRYPQLRLLPHDVTHHQLVDEGLDVCLTVRGTIGFEYPLLGIPVVNASINNPHRAYSFSKNPESVEELRLIVLNLADLPKPTMVHRAEALEYFALKTIHLEDSLFLEIGTPIRYSGLLNSWNPEWHSLIFKKILDFVKSDRPTLRE